MKAPHPQVIAVLERIARSPLPLFADESCLRATDIPKIAAAYHGVNVKVDKAGGLREAAGEAAIRVDPGDVEALAAQLRRVIGDAGLRADLARRGLAHARAFTWDRTARGVLSVVKQTGLSLQTGGA